MVSILITEACCSKWFGPRMVHNIVPLKVLNVVFLLHSFGYWCCVSWRECNVVRSDLCGSTVQQIWAIPRDIFVHTRDAIPFHWALHIKPGFTARRNICLHQMKPKVIVNPEGLFKNVKERCQIESTFLTLLYVTTIWPSFFSGFSCFPDSSS